MSKEPHSFDVLQRERRFLGWGMVISVIIHVLGIGLTEYLQPTSEEVARRVMFVTPTVGGKFVMRAPRVTKRLELRKLPREQGLRVERGAQVITVQEGGIVARTAVAQAEAVVERVVRGTGGVGGRGSRMVGIGEAGGSSGRWSQMGEISMRMRDWGVAKEPERRVDMSLEMLDVRSMDMGRYRAMVIQDPRDKQAIKGFIHLARVYSQSSLRTGQFSGGVGADNFMLRNLADYLNTYTGIRADFLDQVTFDDERLMEVPFIIVSNTAAVLSEEEMKHLTKYLLQGGFIFGIGAWTEGLQKYGRLVNGSDFYAGRLPDDHPIYSVFFNMGRSGTPLTTAGGHQSYKGAVAEWNYLIGLWIKGRLSAVDFPAGGAGTYIWGAGTALGVDSTRHLQLAVNIIIYALTQEGSITHQLMQTVK